jgi:hypothetical protein
MTDHETVTRAELPFGEHAALELEADVGVVEVAPVAEGESPRVTVTGRDADHVDVRVERLGETVRVVVSQDAAFHHWFRTWDARVTVYVPRRIRAVVRTNVGSLAVHDLGPCTLDLSTDAGRITVERVQGRLRLTSDAGTITGEDLSGTFDVANEAGAVRLGITGLDPGEHRVQTSVGTARVRLAPGLAVQIETRASLGSARSDYPSRPDAPAVLRVTTGVGSVRVRAADGGADERDHDHDEHHRRHGPWGAFGARFAERFERRFGEEFGRSRRHPFAPPPPPPPPPPPAREVIVVEEREAPSPAAAERPAGPPDAEVERILKMVEAGELSAAEADELLRALNRE